MNAKTRYTMPELYNSKDPDFLLQALKDSPQMFDAYSVWQNAINLACKEQHTGLITQLASSDNFDLTEEDGPLSWMRRRFHVLRAVLECNDGKKFQDNPNYLSFARNVLSDPVFDVLQDPNRMGIFITDQKDPVLEIVQDMGNTARIEMLYLFLSRLPSDFVMDKAFSWLNLPTMDALIEIDATGLVYDFLDKIYNQSSREHLLERVELINYANIRQSRRDKEVMLEAVQPTHKTGRVLKL